MEWLREHLGYVADPVRTQAYANAIAATVRPGDAVLDLGTGTGILGWMCLEAGARHVYAVDRTAMAEVARETFRRSGFSARTTVIRCDSMHAQLPEPVDVVIADQVGHLGFEYGIGQDFADAAQRLLKPGGRLVPRTLRLFVALAESAQASQLVDSWRSASVPPPLQWLQEIAANTKQRVEAGESELRSEPVSIAQLQLGQPSPDGYKWTAELRPLRAGTANGLLGWFECELAPGIWMSNDPRKTDRLRRPQAFLPFERPIDLQAGRPVSASLFTRAPDIISWVVEGPCGQRLQQSTFIPALLTHGMNKDNRIESGAARP